MIAIDTNIIVRIVTNDDPDQVRRARKLLAGADVFVSKTVVLECEWVLRAAYELERAAILESLRRFLSLPRVEVEDSAAVWQALDGYEAGMDLADALHLASSRSAERFATFDKALIKEAGKRKTIPVVVEP